MSVVVPGRAVPTGGLQARRTRRRTGLRAALLVLFGAFFVVPLLALVEFSTRGTGAGAARNLDAWRAIGSDSDLIAAVVASLELAALTSVLSLVLLVPTMVWVRLRVPWISRVVEFLCLLPLTIPAIVLVVGWAPIYLWVNYFTPRDYQSSPLVLTLAYIVLVLPYAYRTIDAGLSAIDVRTLAEAARSLGAGWGTVVVRIVVPNISAAVLNAALLSVALVLGEFTVASLLHYENLQVALNDLGQADAKVSMAVAASALFVVFVLLFLLSFVGGSRRRGRKGGRS